LWFAPPKPALFMPLIDCVLQRRRRTSELTITTDRWFLSVCYRKAYYGWQFHTKLELAAAQIELLVQQLGPNRPPIWVVTDGAYAKRPFFKQVLAAGMTVISRLRCDAALWSLPVVVDPGQKRGRGRPPK
jgi:hypothetical protein